ncbi:hypothetical protein I0P70_17565 [Pontibacter sp. FD36]|uniref:hypothetical protein n=1 Tax=Pontibacter sp. FD36 TaxID=2789860 RepID=UPI0018A8F9CB|nr:hypothetical protein [Pontibacter sp. FD36]MBF8965060.1 hypothetical protein [Pontibacter sp. FD36]
MSSAYKPIDQNYRELLEALVAKRATARLQFYSDIGEFLTLHATLKELVKRGEEEYLVLTTGEEIRLDRIVRVDDKPAPGYDESFFQCDVH